LHTAGIGRGLEQIMVSRGGNEAPFRPIGSDLDVMAASAKFVDSRCGNAALDDENAGTRGAGPEGRRKMLGMPGRCVNRFLQVHAGMDMP
jgi:hypothetical protein